MQKVVYAGINTLRLICFIMPALAVIASIVEYAERFVEKRRVERMGRVGRYKGPHGVGVFVEPVEAKASGCDVEM